MIDENRPVRDRRLPHAWSLGADEASGALALGDTVRVGQTLRFFVRDAGLSRRETRGRRSLARRRGRPAGAALHLQRARHEHVPAADHDARVVTETLQTGLAGFFLRGEIGPVGGKAFLHGFTATLAIFLEA